MSKIEATVKETSASLYSVEIDTNGHTIIGDEPESYASKNLGPAPYDLLLAALGECIVMTVRWAAIQNKWPLEKVEAHVTHEKQGKKDVFTKQVTLHGESLTGEQRERLYNIASKCPVYRTLTSEATFQEPQV